MDGGVYVRAEGAAEKERSRQNEISDVRPSLHSSQFTDIGAYFNRMQ
jgi:hypothetical protein